MSVHPFQAYLYQLKQQPHQDVPEVFSMLKFHFWRIGIHIHVLLFFFETFLYFKFPGRFCRQQSVFLVILPEF